MKNYSLVGVDGNAFCIMGYVSRAMKECGKTSGEIIAYRERATAGDYQTLVGVSQDVLDHLNDGECDE